MGLWGFAASLLKFDEKPCGANLCVVRFCVGGGDAVVRLELGGARRVLAGCGGFVFCGHGRCDKGVGSGASGVGGGGFALRDQLGAGLRAVHAEGGIVGVWGEQAVDGAGAGGESGRFVAVHGLGAFEAAVGGDDGGGFCGAFGGGSPVRSDFGRKGCASGVGCGSFGFSGCAGGGASGGRVVGGRSGLGGVGGGGQRGVSAVVQEARPERKVFKLVVVGGGDRGVRIRGGLAVGMERPGGVVGGGWLVLMGGFCGAGRALAADAGIFDGAGVEAVADFVFAVGVGGRFWVAGVREGAGRSGFVRNGTGLRGGRLVGARGRSRGENPRFKCINVKFTCQRELVG